MADQTLLDKELDELYKAAAAGQLRGEKIGRQRRIAAYVLKGIAAGGSLIVATGLLKACHQAIGIAVLLAIFIDTISSNHKRLIAEVEAGYAFRSLRNRVKGEFNREASPLYKKREAGDKTVEQQLETLQKSAHTELSTGIETIREKLEKSDIEALRGLSLDQKRAKLG